MKRLICLWLLSLLLLMGCNRDEELTVEESPKIQFNETNIYQVKVAHELAIIPIVKNAKEAAYAWMENGKIVGTDTLYLFSSEEIGTYYLTLRVDTEYGYDEKEIRIDVLALTPPVIALTLPDFFEKGITYSLAPTVLNVDEKTTYTWYLNDKQVANDSVYVFTGNDLGLYKLALQVYNTDGQDYYEKTIEVIERKTILLSFADTFQTVSLGRTLYLKPVEENIPDDVEYSWIVDSVNQNIADKCFAFTPEQEGSYIIEIVARQGVFEGKAKVCVLCTPKEGTYYRPYTGTSVIKVYEFLPAPGQFVNAGYSATTEAQAVAYAQSNIEAGRYVSLGAFGGYITIGFNHSINNSGNYDFAVVGNSFKGSSEPGIVWVMQDENGNGLPDDTWYELKGSEFEKDNYIRDYAVTYYNPEAAGINIAWKDNRGNTGTVDVNSFHTQNYYPAWITDDSYTLYGSCLASNTVDNSSEYGSEYWTNLAYEWGYADNYADTGDWTNTSGNWNRFRISDAVTASGKAADLHYIDFIRIHTGVQGKAGWLGEVSTEVFGVVAINLE